jgi:SAM-dependent methyltransferase
VRDVLDRLPEVLEISTDEMSLHDGYVDLIGDDPPAWTGPAQRLMETRTVPRIYERWWRPALGRIAKGPRGPSMEGEIVAALRLLDLSDGDRLLDVACGPGNFTRRFATAVGPSGLAVGVDVSTTMLHRAVETTDADNVVYVRAPIEHLPVRPATVDAVCCFAALHLFPDPWAGLDVMVRALAPGGRIAILTSAAPPGPAARLVEVGGRLTGMTVFTDDEVTGFIADRGLEVTAHDRHGVMQIVGAHAPA